jgi:hypothetical protein
MGDAGPTKALPDLCHNLFLFVMQSSKRRTRVVGG